MADTRHLKTLGASTVAHKFGERERISNDQQDRLTMIFLYKMILY